MPSYWQVYDRLSGINNFRKVFEEAKGIAEELGEPFEQKKRGRKLKASPKEAGALLIVIRGLNMTFREGEYIARELGYELDHTTLWNYFKRIPEDWLKKAIKLLYSKINETEFFRSRCNRS